MGLALALLLRRRSHVLAMAFASMGLGWLWLWSTPFAADRITRAIEAHHPPLAAAALPRADAILLLGGGTLDLQHHCALDPRSCSRTAFAAALYGAQRAPLIVVSGAGALAARQGTTEAAQMHARLVAAGVPAAAIVVEPTARNTRENMRAAAPLLRERGARSVLLVTSAFHMPRALANAGAEAIPAIAASCDADPLVGEVRGLRAGWPQATALRRSARGLKEYLGLAQAGWFAHEKGREASPPAP